MSKRVVEVQVRAIVAAEGGFAVFLGNQEKTFVIFVDETVGAAIEMSLRGVRKERPLTHDLLANILRELRTKIERVVISDLKSGTCYARLVLTVENELKQKKIMEIDARPSDSIAVAIAQQAPIYVSLNVWEELEDMTEALRKLEAEGLPRQKNGGEGIS
jgi:bifunctional DNase/RNase